MKQSKIDIKDIRYIFKHKKENYYKPVRVGNFWSNNYIEYESNGDRKKMQLLEVYLNKIRSYLKEIINNLKNFDTWEIQLIIPINFIFSKTMMKSK